MDNVTAVQYAGLVQQLIGTSKLIIKSDDPSDDLIFLRLHTKQNEIIIIPGKFQTLIIIVNIFTTNMVVECLSIIY